MHVAKVFILCTATYHLHGTFLTKELIQDTSHFVLCMTIIQHVLFLKLECENRNYHGYYLPVLGSTK